VLRIGLAVMDEPETGVRRQGMNARVL
jgi:hypothetical protein